MNLAALRKTSLPALLFALLALSLLLTLGATRAAPAAIITFQGRVIEGATGSEPGVDPQASYIEGAVVSLWCSGEPYPDQGRLVINDTTDAGGYYGLTMDTNLIGCEYFHIIETDPEGRSSNGAASVDGTVIMPNWIQFDVIEKPIWEQDLTGNKFWDTPLPAETTCTSCTDCSAKLNGDYTRVALAQDITTSINGPCIVVGASNVTFDGGGHTIRNTATGVEFDIGVDIVTRSGVKITGVILDDWGTGIRLQSATATQLISNTITAAGAGIYMVNADGNTLTGNAISQSIFGVQLTGADNNAFTGNTFCRQSKRDIEATNATSGNTLDVDTCDIIYNWNGDQSLSSCFTSCQPLYATGTCATPTDCATKLDGSYGTVTLTGNVSAPGGIVIGGNHVTLDCDGYDIIGSGTGAGLSFSDRVDVTVTNCTLRGFQTGIELRSCAESYLLLNTIENNGVGIALLKTDPLIKSQDNTLESNTIRDNTLYGVKLSNATQNAVVNGYISGNSYDVWVEGDCQNTISDGGVAYYHDQTGGTLTPSAFTELLLLCNVDKALVTGVAINNLTNLAHNNGVVIVDSSGTELRGARVSYSNGITVLGGDHITVTNSSVISATYDGITFDGSSYGAVISNSVALSGGYGIALVDGAGSAQVLRNTVGASRTSTSGANAGGILVRDSSGVTLQSNFVRRNAGDGIHLQGASLVTLSRNTVRANAYGLYLDNSTSQTTVSQNEFCYSSGKDIYNNSGTGASGDNNTCSDLYFWADTGETSACTNRCVGWYNRDWGYSFKNPVVDNLSYTRYAQTFGNDETWLTVKVCAGVPVCVPFKCWCIGKMVDIPTGVWDPWAAGLYYLAYRDIGEPGTCVGMAASSLAFYYGHDDPANYDPAADEVKDLAANSASGSYDLTVRREILHGSQMSTEALGYYLGGLTSGQDSANYVLTQARSSLDSGQMNFVLIKNGLLEGHAVNYDTVVDVDATTVRLYVYDSNITTPVTTLVDTPDSYPYITVDTAANNWSYPMGSATWGNDKIFDMPYSILNRSDWTLPLSTNGILNAVFGSAQAGIADMGGHLLGFDRDGIPHEEIPGGMGLPTWGAAASRGHRLLVQPGDYDIHLFGSDGVYTDTIVGLGGGYSVQSIPVTEATDDLYRLRLVDGNPQHTTLGFSSLDPEKPFNVSMIKGWDPAGERRTFRIFAAPLGNETLVWVKVLPDLSGAVIANRGRVPFPFALEFRNAMVRQGVSFPPGGPVRVIGGLVVNPGQTLVVSPLDWGDLGTSVIEQELSTCGDGVADLGEDSVNCPADVAPAPACVMPEDDLAITMDTRICPGFYHIPDGGLSGVLRVTGSYLTLDCGGATFEGEGAGSGIRINSVAGVVVTGCQLRGYAVGIDLSESSDVALSQSLLMGNTARGLSVSETVGLYVSELFVGENARGIEINNAGGVEIARTSVCANTGTDIATEASSDLIGTENACDTVINWNDVGVDACTYTCEGGIVTGGSVYLPLVLKR